MKIHGCINSEGNFVDMGFDARATKRMATMKGYSRVGYRFEHTVVITHRKKGKKWITLI